MTYTNVNNNNIILKEVKDVPEDYAVKVVIVGDSGVGKSNILSRFVLNEFSNDCRATVGVELSTKSYQINNSKIIKLHLWDTAGQERFKSVTSAYYRGVRGAIVVYDITNKDSFDHVDKWLNEIKNLGGKSVSIVVCGNKCDLIDNRKVSKEEGIEKSTSNSLSFLETSALTADNVEEAFKCLITEIYNTSIKEAIKTDTEDFNQGTSLKIETDKKNNSTKKKCC